MLHGIHCRSHHHYADGFYYLRGKGRRCSKTQEAEGVLKGFGDNQRRQVHRDIKNFVREMGVLKAVVGKDIILEKAVELIAQRLTPSPEGR